MIQSQKAETTEPDEEETPESKILDHLGWVPKRKAGLPVLMRPLSGSVSDPGSFPELIDRHVEHLPKRARIQLRGARQRPLQQGSSTSKNRVRKLTEGGVRFVTRVLKTNDQRGEKADLRGGDRVNGTSRRGLPRRSMSLGVRRYGEAVARRPFGRKPSRDPTLRCYATAPSRTRRRSNVFPRFAGSGSRLGSNVQ